MPASALDELAAAVEAAHPGLRLAGFSELAGGHSGLTHVATLCDPAGAEVKTVVKSTPAGRRPVGRHDVLRQARVLEALSVWGGVATPAITFTMTDPVNAFGMEFAAGCAAEPVMADARLGETPEVVEAAWGGAVAVLADLQRAVPAELGLGGEPVVTPRAEVERWAATMRSAGLDTGDPRASELGERLLAAVPAELDAVVVHGDLRLGNMLQRPDGTIAALVDWEIWTLGDPRFDLGWLTLFTDASNWPGFGRQAAGTPSATEVVARWSQATGRPAEGADWFRALACFKLAAIQAHNLRRHREGRYPDPHQERVAPGTGALLERGLGLV